jgi:hypothetical protein
VAQTIPARGALQPLGICADVRRARKVRGVNSDQELP